MADLAKTAFLKFLYFSDFETFSPSSTARMSTFVNDTFTVSTNRQLRQHHPVRGPDGHDATPSCARREDQVRRGCEMYYYKGRSTFPRTVQWAAGRHDQDGGDLVRRRPTAPYPSGIRPPSSSA